MSPSDTLYSFMTPEGITTIGRGGHKLLSDAVILHTYNHSYPIIDVRNDDITSCYSLCMEPDECIITFDKDDTTVTFKHDLTEEQFFQFSLIEDFGQLDYELVRACFDFSDYYMENRGEL